MLQVELVYRIQKHLFNTNIILKATCLDNKITVPLRRLFRYAYGVRIRSQNLSHKYCNGKVYFSISLSVIRGCEDVVEDLIIE